MPGMPPKPVQLSPGSDLRAQIAGFHPQVPGGEQMHSIQAYPGAAQPQGGAQQRAMLGAFQGALRG